MIIEPSVIAVQGQRADTGQPDPAAGLDRSFAGTPEIKESLRVCRNRGTLARIQQPGQPGWYLPPACFHIQAHHLAVVSQGTGHYLSAMRDIEGWCAGDRRAAMAIQADSADCIRIVTECVQTLGE